MKQSIPKQSMWQRTTLFSSIRLRRSLPIATMLFWGSLWAQPGSIATRPAPVVGPVIFDTAGNLYSFTFGPVTPGAVQTQNGGGTCLSSNGFLSTPGPCADAYVSKLDAAGHLVFGTNLGGPTADHSTALAVDASGNLFVTGSTGGSFPTTAKAAIPSSATARAFAAKISADGTRLLYSTYLPETVAAASAVAVDYVGNAYIAGTTITGHASVLKLSADGSSIQYNIELAGTGRDAALAIAAGADGSAFVAGQTSSPDFPVTQNVFQRQLNGAQNIFVTKLNPSGIIVVSTYLGGSGADAPTSIQIDSTDNVYVAGQTSSLDFPTTSHVLQPAPSVPLWNNSAPAGFVARFKAGGARLVYSSFVTSSDHALQQGVTHLAISASGDTYIAGLTGASFPVTPSAPQLCFRGPIYSAFIAHLDSSGALRDATYAGENVLSVRGLSLAADGAVLMLSDSAGISAKSEIRFGGDGQSARTCLSPSVLNAATMSGTLILPTAASSDSSPVTPGEFITLTGFGIGPDAGVTYQADPQGRISQSLAGVQVLFDGRPAPVLYVQSRQINALAPVELSGQTQTVITVLFNQATVGSITVPVSDFGAPGIFRSKPGASSQAAALNEDGTLNGPSNPAVRGSVVSVFGTGFGLVAPSCITGGLNPPGAANLAAGLAVIIADAQSPGVPVNYAPAVYAGNAPGQPCGLVQINMTVPDYVSPGMYQFFPWSGMTRPGGDQIFVPGTVGVTISVK